MGLRGSASQGHEQVAGCPGIEADPEQVGGYVYGVLNGPAYRRRFGDALRYDFARIPFARDPVVFTDLAATGRELIAMHLLEHPSLDAAGPMIDGDDQALIEGPRFDAREQAVYLAPTLVAHPVTAATWAYQQGAYQVLKRYLEDRQGRSLGPEEFEDFRLVAAAVSLTLARLPRLDELLAQACENAFSAAELGLDTEA